MSTHQSPKGVLRSVLLAIFLTAVASTSRADYQVTFSTGANDLSNPVFDVSGSVGNTASYLAGTAFKAQLYVGANAGSLTAVGSGGQAISSSSAGDTTGIRTFLSGGGAGFINGGTFTVTSGSLNAGNAAVYQMRVWEAAYSSYEQAAGTVNAKIGSSVVTAFGASGLGGTVIVNGNPTVISAQANLHGAFGLVTVPEPATVALGLFGAAGLLIRRRK